MPSIPSTLLGDCSPAEFLDEYWQKKPLLVRGALPAFRSPLAPEELAGLACEEGVESRLILEEGGDYPWQLRYGPFVEEDFLELPETHWSLLVQEVDVLIPAVERLREHFRFVPRWRIDDVMISYAPEGGSVGAHVDSYDVFLLQGLGRRRWQIETTPVEEEKLVSGLDVRLLEDFAPDEEWVLEPGDLLYLPPRIPHYGVALGDCMTYSIGFRAPSRQEIVSGYLEDAIARLDPEDRYGDPDLTPARHPGEIRPEALQKVRAAIRQITEDDRSIDRWFGRFVTKPQRGHRLQPPEEPTTPEGLVSALRKGATLRRKPAARLAFLENGEETVLFAGGRAYDLDAELAFAGPLLADHVTPPAKELAAHLDEAAFAELLATLVNDGIFELDK